MGKVQIIGGTHRSRVINFSDKFESIRPTPNKVRQTLFNWLDNDLTNKVCLDAYAGSGALGFEALSLGAKQVVMLEKDPAIYKQLTTNRTQLKMDDLQIINTDAINYIKNSSINFDLIFLDPPYDSDLLIRTLELIKLHQILESDGLIYIEYDKIPALLGYQIIKQKKAASVGFGLVKPEKAASVGSGIS